MTGKRSRYGYAETRGTCDVWRAIRRTVPAGLLLLIIACAPDDGSGNGPAGKLDPDGRMTLRVMSFNIERGGTHVRFGSIAEAIREADADIVGVQEAEGNLEQLADELGWHFNRRNDVVSRFPLVDPAAGRGSYLFVEVAPGRVVAVANLHLPSEPFGEAWFRNGRSEFEVAAMERETRLPAIEPILGSLSEMHRTGMPVLLAGDFNAPSHADWTEAARGKLPYRDRMFDWPVSVAIAGAGFRDSYRSVHPDPVSHPGFTWWAGRPKIEDYNPSDPTHRSRIDFVWFAGPVEVVDSRIVGEENADGVDLAINPWPSDHRAVLSVFEVQPAPMPELVAASQRVYRVGEAVQFTYRSAGTVKPTIMLERASTPNAITPRIRLRAPAPSGTAKLPDQQLSAGHYEVSLLDEAGWTLSAGEFWILEPDAPPTLSIGGDTFTAGAALPVEWSGAPGNRHDWIGIFPASNEDTHQFLAFGYIDSRSSGSMRLDSGTAEAGWPVPPGEYVAKLLIDDGYEVLAESMPFRVTVNRD